MLLSVKREVSYHVLYLTINTLYDIVLCGDLYEMKIFYVMNTKDVTQIPTDYTFRTGGRGGRRL